MKPAMRLKHFRWLACCLLIVCFTASVDLLSAAQHISANPDLTVHEWGTFTSIAGNDGRAVEWLPLTGSTDLPDFVEHLRDVNFKPGLRGTVRMETPVLYFYSPREQTVSVKVAFSEGLITEWYPHASRVEPVWSPGEWSSHQRHADGNIAWDVVNLEPNSAAEFPREGQDNHYYAARDTSSTPLRVKTPSGDQREKFLFYRGVASFSPPVSATLTPDGKVLVKNLGEEEIPNAILFQRRGEKVGYRLGGVVQDETSLGSPELTGTIDSLSNELEQILIAQGLNPDEAHAMLETWRYSWFEEGSRLLYIVPVQFVNTVLPLAIHPAPVQTVRVFVGRLEVITPATQRAVERALATSDNATLGKYQRFLEPIQKIIADRKSNAARAVQLR